MKIVGIILILLGLVGFIIGGVSFTQTEQVADVGPIEIEKQEQESIPISPWASGAAVVVGIALVAIDARRKKA